MDIESIAASPDMKQYFKGLVDELNGCYEIARAARSMNRDPENFVEIFLTSDLASRVEGIVGPKGVGELIRELEKAEKSREMLAYKVVKNILEGGFGIGNQEKRIDQAVRTGVGILTEGVLVAPTEGIDRIVVKQNPDGTNYLSIYYAGPIRSAGGTVAALSVVLCDIARKHFGIGDFRPTAQEVERYVEEISMYHTRGARLQYKPSDDDLRWLVNHCPICVDGSPTETFEVAVNRDMARFETNRVRGGIGLVLCEGVAQKATKVLKITRSVGLDWSWLEAIIKIRAKGDKAEIKKDLAFMDDVVAGRIAISYPTRAGGFRLRYGMGRMSGLMSKAIHPATMVMLDDFIAIGTQVRVDRPGKGCVITTCDAIDGPIVKLENGAVAKVNDYELAKKLRPEVVEVLQLGELLVSYADFNKSNHPLLPCCQCHDYWSSELEAKAPEELKGIKSRQIGALEAFALAKKTATSLHPDYTYFWHDIDAKQVFGLANYLATGKFQPVQDGGERQAKDKGLFGGVGGLGGMGSIGLVGGGSFAFCIPFGQGKHQLEEICVEHKVAAGVVEIRGDDGLALLLSLGMLRQAFLAQACGKPEEMCEQFNKQISVEYFLTCYDDSMGALELVNKCAGVHIRAKAPHYIGARMGRPEKAKRREMKPLVQSLFPLGHIEKSRNILKVYESSKDSTVQVELARRRCRECKCLIPYSKCQCGGLTDLVAACIKCKKETSRAKCSCGGQARSYDLRSYDLKPLMKEAIDTVGFKVDVKGVKGLISKDRMPEILEKGLLRAKYDLSIYRDGTCRFDATDIPVVHFKPKEIHTLVTRLRELGYLADVYGKELRSDDQICRLRPQDIIVSENCGDYFFKVAGFIDELLIKVYKTRPYYNLKSKADVIGQLAVGLSPHTSAGILCRIIGFTKIRATLGHPYYHAAKRRNCDGDEDAVMLLLDALINFSKCFLPESRGGTMDAPLILITVINPKEIDDEAHCIETCTSYGYEFYSKADSYASPSDVKIPIIKDLLGKPEQYDGTWFTHDTGNFEQGVLSTAYVKFESMADKVDAQFAIQNKLRAVDSRDVAQRIINSHFLPDIYGNLRSYSRQIFRCVDCGRRFRRIPLVGKCLTCGGKLLLTINKGGIEKYIELTKKLAIEYNLPAYVKQRVELIESDVKSLFDDDKVKQVKLADYI
ncbi:DNA polymerase II large subunit [Candidatus Micrarchaeota archaeon CG1_02_49_24]|nr:MAG: DNA polymerase II large subunit [Candidatus Micrarchaeota archaeon CG1_02_49_24]HII54289.1 DNA polymerase II large subunit [Candidatus Micrarchaeota archaeon]